MIDDLTDMTRTDDLRALLASMVLRRSELLEETVENVHPSDVSKISAHFGAIKEVGEWIKVVSALISQEGE